MYVTIAINDELTWTRSVAWTIGLMNKCGDTFDIEGLVDGGTPSFWEMPLFRHTSCLLAAAAITSSGQNDYSVRMRIGIPFGEMYHSSTT
jgi:hypothetical protein